MKRPAARWFIPIAAAGWGLVIGAGLLAMGAYESSPGPVGRALRRWPTGSRVPRAVDRPTLIMGVHPRCPCTRASVAELARVLAACEGRVEVFVLILAPQHGVTPWVRADWLSRLGTISGVHLFDDPGGLEADRFGARTSGHVALYAPEGHLLFHGGITIARGHEGDNAGREAALALISGGRPAGPAATPVFGCPLVEPSPVSSRSVRPWND
jgi:hypothetical protein